MCQTLGELRSNWNRGKKTTALVYPRRFYNANLINWSCFHTQTQDVSYTTALVMFERSHVNQVFTGIHIYYKNPVIQLLHHAKDITGSSFMSPFLWQRLQVLSLFSSCLRLCAVIALLSDCVHLFRVSSWLLAALFPLCALVLLKETLVQKQVKCLFWSTFWSVSASGADLLVGAVLSLFL